MKLALCIAAFMFCHCLPGTSSNRLPDIMPEKPNVIKKDSTTNQILSNDPNMAIHVNGNNNTVIVDSGTKEAKQKVMKSKHSSNCIEINGQRNSVSVTQEQKGKVVIKQNGNNNQISISQSSHQP